MRSHLLTIGTICAIALGLSSPSASAQEAVILRLRTGDTLEIATDSEAQSPTFSWVLTKDRKFQNAQRSRFFQARLTQVGTYVLDVTVQDAASSVNEYRAFTIIVTDTGPAPTGWQKNEDGPIRAIVTTDPVAQGNTIYIPQEGGIIRIDPSSSEGTISTFSMDLDSAVDVNGDGNSTNDPDNESTISERTGSPVYLYALPRSSARSITLTTTNEQSSEQSTAEVSIATGKAPVSATGNSSASRENVTSQSGLIGAIPEGLKVRFQAQSSPSLQGKELLYQWDFGDRSRSLLTSPVHTYKSTGSYNVSLAVIDLRTGQPIASDAVSVLVTEISGATSSSEESSASSEPAKTTSSTSAKAVGATSNSISYRSIMTVGFIVVSILLLFFFLFFLIVWIKGKATHKFQEALETMENKIVQKEKKVEIAGVNAEPMKLRKDDAARQQQRDAITEREQQKPAFVTPARSSAAPTMPSGPVPPWLSNAASSPVHSSPPVATPPKPVSITPAPTAKPSINPPAARILASQKPQNASNDASAPDWLKTPVPTQPAQPPTTRTPSVPAQPPKSTAQANAGSTQTQDQKIVEKAVAQTLQTTPEPPVVERSSFEPTPTMQPPVEGKPVASPSSPKTLPVSPAPMQAPPPSTSTANATRSPSQPAKTKVDVDTSPARDKTVIGTTAPVSAVPTAKDPAPEPGPKSTDMPTPSREGAQATQQAPLSATVEATSTSPEKESDTPIAFIQADSLVMKDTTQSQSAAEQSIRSSS